MLENLGSNANINNNDNTIREIEKNSFEIENPSYLNKDAEINFTESYISKINENKLDSILETTEKNMVQEIFTPNIKKTCNCKSPLTSNCKCNIAYSNSMDSSKSYLWEYFNQLDDNNVYILLFKRKVFSRINRDMILHLNTDKEKYEEFFNSIEKYFKIGFVFCFEGILYLLLTYRWEF